MLHGTASLKGPHEVVVETADGLEEIRGDMILLATGSRPRVPDGVIVDGERYTAAEIAARGLLLSQFWPDAPPQKHTFLIRNATMSGYGLATVVVEAGEYSGARVQARIAVEHGRPVILTGLVVERNEWARALVPRPGVHVADSLTSVLRVVDQLTAERGAVGSELQRLASS